VLRASAACEQAGFPTASLTCEGFIAQFKATSVGLGMPTIPYALVPGHVGLQDDGELRRNIRDVTVDYVIENLTRFRDASTARHEEPKARDVVFRGDFDAVNEFFLAREWSDGLPIVPPTVERIERFLQFVDRDPEEVLGVLLPDMRTATIWSVAVNGVMAGCRPEYMPLLVAIVEAMADPDYGVEHSGNTPGGETLIILNGPLVDELRVNSGQGVMRDGFQANTSVGRFWRLYLRNVAGFLLHQTDKCTFGNTWRVMIAENEGELPATGWVPNSVEMGFAAGDNVVTIARYTGGNLFVSVQGDARRTMLPHIASVVKQQISWQLMFTMSQAFGKLRPLVLLTPIIAGALAKAGFSKLDVKHFLFEHTRMPASEFEHNLERIGRPMWKLSEQVALGRMPAVYAESADPDRLVPIVWKPEDFMLLVTGDPLRNNAYAFAHNGNLGYPVAKKIRLPENWSDRLREARG